MEGKLLSKMGVIVIVLLLIAYASVVMLSLWYFEFPTWIVAIEAIVLAVLIIWLSYYALERLREIDGGEEDAVNDY